MLDRGLVETALGGADWLEAAAMLASTPLVDRSEDERWRIRSMAACARVMAQGATGRDAAVQVRELVRLSDGNLTLSEQLMACIADQSLPKSFVKKVRIRLVSLKSFFFKSIASVFCIAIIGFWRNRAA